MCGKMRLSRPGCAMGVFQEEADHLFRGRWTPWVGVRPCRAPTSPGMAGSMNDPLFGNGSSASVDTHRTTVGMATGYLTVFVMTRNHGTTH
jgi:hypothetical protein